MAGKTRPSLMAKTLTNVALSNLSLTDKKCIEEVFKKFEVLTSADVVELKHGYWIDKPSGRYLHIASWCSVCGNKSGIGGIESNRHKPYCPNCGAKMDGKRKEKNDFKE